MTRMIGSERSRHRHVTHIYNSCGVQEKGACDRHIDVCRRAMLSLLRKRHLLFDSKLTLEELRRSKLLKWSVIGYVLSLPACGYYIMHVSSLRFANGGSCSTALTLAPASLSTNLPTSSSFACIDCTQEARAAAQALLGLSLSIGADIATHSCAHSLSGQRGTWAIRLDAGRSGWIVNQLPTRKCCRAPPSGHTSALRYSQVQLVQSLSVLC